MEIRRLLLCTAFFVVAVISQYSEARHSMHSLQRRDAEEDINYDEEPQQADEASDNEPQNDTEIAGTNEPPKKPSANILSQPTTYEAKAGTDLVLECKVSPDKGTVVNWYKNDSLYFMGTMKLQTSATRHSIVANTHDLEIKNFAPGDEGSYRCVVMNDKPISITHTVVLMTAPKITRFTATNYGSVKEGSDVLLTCDVSGVPPPNIMWSRNEHGENRRLAEKDGEFSHNTVYLKDLKREDSGEYYCYALNSLGHSQKALSITVYGKPRVHVHKTVVNSAVNVEAILECTTHEDDDVHMRWYKDGKLIEDSSTQYTVSTNGSHSNLTVVPSSDDDFGTFTCEAENPHGNHNRSIELVQRPVLEDFSTKGSKLMWTVHSHQPLEAIEVQIKNLEGESDWQQINVPLPETKGHRYQITYDLENNNLDAGKYVAIVKVKNNHSWSGNSEPKNVEIEARAQYIQHASVFRTSNAHSIRTSSVIPSTVLMYLLVRMF
ncbi:hypothetical protein K1T71_013958 [Dendrolimus kikuchii]|uniref:Uncharacterized protein n=1 Tax=Dendrolimus kikuchii TaxID=765133 RepID=A0ACC1CGL1_9NEOP|nr:hypothetical protein K1T71_013958 [Dendrolimus kikuchii]